MAQKPLSQKTHQSHLVPRFLVFYHDPTDKFLSCLSFIPYRLELLFQSYIEGFFFEKKIGESETLDYLTSPDRLRIKLFALFVTFPDTK